MSADNGSFIRTLYGGTGGKPMLMAQSDEISNKNTEEESSSKDSGLDYESIITKRMTEIKGSCDYVALYTGTTKTSYNQMDDWRQSGELVPYIWGTVTDKDAVTFIPGTYKYSGFVRFMDDSLKAEDKKKATFSYSAKCQGARVKTLVV